MRQPAPRSLVLLLLALFVSVGAQRAYADARSDARTHYQAGVKFYSAGDYRAAIKEFAAAQQLAPADLNNYNLGLCYDKLGEAEPAIQYYREFLTKQPNAGKRAEIEASIARLEAALASASGKRADEARRAEEARKAEEARAAEEARKAGEARKPLPPTGTVAPEPSVTGDVDVGVATGVGSTGTPATGQTVSTGDAQLDRVSSIDINSIRDQRGGAGGPPPTGGVAGAQGGAAGPADQPPAKPTPVYKKWWFWAVVVVGAIVVIAIATEDSNSTTRAREVPAPAPRETGLTLLRF